MKVAALAHFSMPWRNCGSETVLHELMRAAASAGHEVTVYVTHKDARTTWRGNQPPIVLDGVRIIRAGNPLLAAKAMARSRPGVVVTHHQHATLGIRAAKQVRARAVFLTHNAYDLNARPMRAHPSLVIHNSTHVAETLNSKFGEPKEWFLFHPPLTPDRHTVPSTGDALTLINLNRDKGCELFYRLAEAMPDRKFVGVIGGHGEQVIRRNLPNVTILEHGPDMKRVWSATRVLLMPSEFESYGLTAVEAGINGIPTIAHPTPGLVENLGSDGLFADRDRLVEWVDLITNLDKPNEYDKASRKASYMAECAMRATRRSLTQWTEWLDGVA